MTDDMGCDLEFPDVDKLTFQQWRDWLAQYNKFIGERDVRYAAGLRERDDRIEKLEAVTKDDAKWLATYHKWCEMNGCAPSSSDLISARKALEGKDDSH